MTAFLFYYYTAFTLQAMKRNEICVVAKRLGLLFYKKLSGFIMHWFNVYWQHTATLIPTH